MKTEQYDNQEEKQYTKEINQEHRKSLGQFFTPYKIARFMSEWIIGNPKEKLKVLDPAVGLGVFERALTEINTTKNIDFDVWDIDAEICKRLQKIFDKKKISARINNADFIESCSWEERYDGIIANPPYYKHHFINNKEKVFQSICVKTYYQFSIQTNIYCWFLIKSIKLLAENGRLAFIIPSEFMNSNYGEKVKSYIKDSGVLLHLININFEENVFDNAMTTSVIILAEKTKQNHGFVKLYNVSRVDEIDNLNTFLQEHEAKSLPVQELNPKAKWRNYFSTDSDNYNKNQLIKFSEIGRFSRGIATGSNGYFTLSLSEIEKHKLSSHSLSHCITKSAHAKSLCFSKDDLESLINEDKKCFIFNGCLSSDENSKKYISYGESMGIDQLYLTKNREPWYALEKRGISKIWVSVFGRSGLKFVWNNTDAVNLTCFHSFYPTELGKKFLDILFIYLNTKVAKKLLDKEKREYGNGLSKFEPNDINKSLILNFNLINETDVEKLRELQKLLISNRDNDVETLIAEADNLVAKYFE